MGNEVMSLHNTINRAKDLSAERRHPEALLLWRRAVDVSFAFQGENVRQFAYVREGLAHCLSMLGSYEEAERLYLALIEDLERILSPQDPTVCHAVKGLVLCMYRQKKFAQALQYTKRAVIDAQRQFGASSGTAIFLRVAQLRAFEQLGLKIELIELGQETLISCLSSKSDRKLRYTHQVLDMMAKACRSLSQHRCSASPLQQIGLKRELIELSQGIVISCLSSKSDQKLLHTYQVLSVMAKAYRSFSQHLHSAHLLREAVNIGSQILAASSAELTTAKEMLSRELVKSNQLDEALAVMEELVISGGRSSEHKAQLEISLLELKSRIAKKRS